MKIKSNKILYITTFFLVCLCISIIYALNKVYPFGSKTILALDMSGQYVNYLTYFRNIFFDHANIFYNFSMNFGSNCFGLFAYYLSSPLNIILCFFSVKNITEGILLLNIIKLGLAGMTMSIYLRKTKKLDNISIIILSIMYSLMSYNIVYSQNIMWLDGSIYLPLVILGIENIINNKKSYLYIVSLFLCIVSNFYIGYMVGIFSFIYAIINFILSSNKIKDLWKENKKQIKNYIKATLICLLLSMIILIPVAYNLLNSKSDINQEDFKLDTYYSPIDAISKMTIGAFNNKELTFGAPNIFCGTLCIIMSLLFFINSSIKNKEKILYFLLTLGMILCFVIIPLNIIMHMLQSPVWFPFRDSFILSFILILLASKNMENMEKIEFNSLIKTQALLIFIIMILHKFYYEYLSTNNVILTMIFISITGFLYFNYKDKGKIYKIILVMVVMLEMILNGYQIVKQIGYVEKNDFTSIYDQVNEKIQTYKSKRNDFYRMETKIARSQNDAMLYNYNGFYHYSSVSGKANKNFLTNFGIRHSLIPENASNTTLPMSSILGVKYYIAYLDKDIGQNREWYDEIDKNVLRNKYSLNLGFMVNNKASNINLEENEPLENQNKLFSNLTELNLDIYKKIEIEDIQNIQKNVDDEIYLVCKFENVSGDIKIYYDDKLYLENFETNENSNNVIYVPKNISKISIRVPEEEREKCSVEAYKFLSENFEKIYNIISKNQLEVEFNNNSYIKGKIDSAEDGLLLTSIIDDDGWEVKVDGKKVDKKVVAENLLAVDMTKGSHIVEFYYRPPYLWIGLILSIIGVIWLVGDNVKNKIKGKDIK